MKLDKAVATLDAAGARRRVRVAEAEGKADKLRVKLRQARQREAPARKWLPHDVVRVATLAGEGASIGEIARLMGSTRHRMSSLLRYHGIAVVPRRPSEVCRRIVLPRSADEALTRLAVDRDIAPEVLIAAALEVLAAEPVVLSNLLDDASA